MFSRIAQLTLRLFGWQPVTSRQLDKFHRFRRKVAIFPHTTYWDFPILATYMLAYWQDSQQLYVAVRSDWATGWLKSVFEYFGAIPINRTKSNRMVDQLTRRFQSEEEFTILIAPEGTTRRQNWRTGYFYLARQLDCPIQVVGLDYHRHRVVIGETFQVGQLTEYQLRTKLFEAMSGITPRYPYNSVVYYQSESEDLPASLVDWTTSRIRLTLLVIFVVLLTLINTTS